MRISKFFSNFDYVMFFSVIILTVLSVLFVYSGNYNKSGELQTQYLKQLMFAVIGLVFLILILFIQEKDILDYSIFLYAVCVLGLIATLFFPEFKGQKRFQISFISIQFSEFMKIASILMLSKFYNEKSSEEKRKLSTYLKSSIIIIIPIFLILLQPDLGTMLVFIPIFLFLSFFTGVKKRYLIYTVLLIFFITLIPVITSVNKLFFNNENKVLNLLVNQRYVITIYITLSIILVISLLVNFNIIKGLNNIYRRVFYWILFGVSALYIGGIISFPVNYYILKPYQKDRIMIFFNPYIDPKDKGYNIIQSMATIGNGGVVGRGWCKGEQIQNFFLPEQATDFIFPVIGEEMGFLGSLLILFLYSLIFYRGLIVAMNARYYWQSYIVLGILSMLIFHILQNIGMTIGIMPITGIPLPFLSYGGTFIISCYIGVGLMMNIHLNRYQF